MIPVVRMILLHSHDSGYDAFGQCVAKHIQEDGPPEWKIPRGEASEAGRQNQQPQPVSREHGSDSAVARDGGGGGEGEEEEKGFISDPGEDASSIPDRKQRHQKTQSENGMAGIRKRKKKTGEEKKKGLEDDEESFTCSTTEQHSRSLSAPSVSSLSSSTDSRDGFTSQESFSVSPSNMEGWEEAAAGEEEEAGMDEAFQRHMDLESVD